MAADAPPFELSIIIATYNRAAMLRTCLEALSRQTQPPADFEVVVVVDGSTDATAAMLKSLAVPFALRVIEQPNAGQAAALNRGIAEAAGRYCLFLDDDILAEPQLVSEHLRAQRASGACVGLGFLSCLVPPDADGFARHFAAWWASHYERLARGRPPTFADCFSGNMSAPRAALLAVGGFATDLPRGYDIELGYRLQRDGLELVFLPNARARQDYRKRFVAIAADAFAEGMAAVALYRRHPEMIERLPLGQFAQAGPRATALRRLLLALGVPARPLALVGRLLRGGRSREWYGFVYGYCYWRGVRRAVPDRDMWRRLVHGVAILMYHAFGPPGEPASRYVVPGRRFARQLAWLKWAGYHVLSLDELLRYRQEHRLPPARSIVLTIDDGYADNRAVAGPLLRRYGYPATIFLVSGAIGDSNRWDSAGVLAGRALLDWPALQALRAQGIGYGAHTRTHGALRGMAAERLHDEVFGSRADLERALGEPVASFAYPYGEYDAQSVGAAERAGFAGACTIRRGLNSPATPRYELKRIEVYGTDSLARFVCGLWAGDMEALARRKRR